MFDIGQKSSTFLLEIIMLVSSANIMGSDKSDKVLIVGGRPFFQYIMKSKGPRIDPWETP
jgi:hypothetical protein